MFTVADGYCELWIVSGTLSDHASQKNAACTAGAWSTFWVTSQFEEVEEVEKHATVCVVDHVFVV